MNQKRQTKAQAQTPPFKKPESVLDLFWSLSQSDRIRPNYLDNRDGLTIASELAAAIKFNEIPKTSPEYGETKEYLTALMMMHQRLESVCSGSFLRLNQGMNAWLIKKLKLPQLTEQQAFRILAKHNFEAVPADRYIPVTYREMESSIAEFLWYADPTNKHWYTMVAAEVKERMDKERRIHLARYDANRRKVMGAAPPFTRWK
jgi:hypothetical protein